MLLPYGISPSGVPDRPLAKASRLRILIAFAAVYVHAFAPAEIFERQCILCLAKLKSCAPVAQVDRAAVS